MTRQQTAILSLSIGSTPVLGHQRLLPLGGEDEGRPHPGLGNRYRRLLPVTVTVAVLGLGLITYGLVIVADMD